VDIQAIEGLRQRFVAAGISEAMEWPVHEWFSITAEKSQLIISSLDQRVVAVRIDLRRAMLDILGGIGGAATRSIAGLGVLLGTVIDLFGTHSVLPDDAAVIIYRLYCAAAPVARSECETYLGEGEEARLRARAAILGLENMQTIRADKANRLTLCEIVILRTPPAASHLWTE